MSEIAKALRYVSDGTWFDKGTEAKLIDAYDDMDGDACGLWEGLRNGKEDEEGCGLMEFDVLDSEGRVIQRAGEDGLTWQKLYLLMEAK